MEPLLGPSGTLTVQEPTEVHPYYDIIYHGGLIHGMHLNRETDIGWALISMDELRGLLRYQVGLLLSTAGLFLAQGNDVQPST